MVVKIEKAAEDVPAAFDIYYSCSRFFTSSSTPVSDIAT